MQANRRDFLKTQALTASAAAAGIPITAIGAPAATPAPADAAVLARASPHWLRHSYATAAANAEVPLELVRDQLGHASLDTTLIYRHREDLDRARRLRHVTL